MPWGTTMRSREPQTWPMETASSFGSDRGLWLKLLREQSLTMNPDERVKLIDAAMCSRCPVGFLAGVQSAFRRSGRSENALMASALGSLLGAGEIESVMHMRAEWRDERDGAKLKADPS